MITIICSIYILSSYYLMLQDSSVIDQNDSTIKVEKNETHQNTLNKIDTLWDKIYLLEAIGNNSVSTKILREKLSHIEWKILATDLNFLTENDYIVPIVSSSENIDTQYILSSKGKEYLKRK